MRFEDSSFVKDGKLVGGLCRLASTLCAVFCFLPGIFEASWACFNFFNCVSFF